MGVVYHAHYIDYFEAARTEALREKGLMYKAIEDAGIMMPVIDLAVQFKRPAFYDDLLAITVVSHEIPRMRIRTDYEVRRAEASSVLVSGHVTLCFLDAATRRPVEAPEALISLYSPENTP